MHIHRLFTLTIFLLGLVVFDWTLGFALNRSLPRSAAGDVVGYGNLALEQSGADLIVLGSSRALHQIDPQVLKGELGIDAVNGGVDGQGIAYARAVEALLSARGMVPKVFVLNMDISDMAREDLSPSVVLAPFWGENEAVDEILLRSTSHGQLKFFSSVFRFNSRALPLLAKLFTQREEKIHDGFSPIERTMDDDPEKIEIGGDWFWKGAEQLDPFKMQLYRNFLKSARAAGTRVFVVVGPRFWPPDFEQDPRTAPIDRLAGVASEEGASFFALDSFSNPEFSDPDLYSDPAHLNSAGARLYSERLAREIAKTLEAS